ncbi:DUF3027 domain-containing protein [Pseudactinotalea sp. Z1748]|uniref:DUF3027 domain-containing protein n=1 Tax=Pseudactinotalea sp. Z1748 TaxID=3413027 RepID=UPI003C7A1068
MSSTRETFAAPARTGSVRKPNKDAVLAGAVDLARMAVASEAGTDLGEYLGFELEGERLGTHYFTTTAPGYVGWRWFVTLTRAPRSRTPAVAEVGLLPGEGSLVAPEWVPWADRLAPGDLSATDRLPYDPDDERLERGYVATGDPEADRVAIRELGLGRDRVMNRKALDAAATRWYNGPAGPDTSGSRKAGADCASCGFLVPLAGSLGTLFGVCANEWSPDDGKVVSLDHGCGAHSETDVRRQGGEWTQSDPHLNDLELEVVVSLEREADEPEGSDGQADSPADSAESADSAPDAAQKPADDGAAGAEPVEPAEPVEAKTGDDGSAGAEPVEPAEPVEAKTGDEGAGSAGSAGPAEAKTDDEGAGSAGSAGPAEAKTDDDGAAGAEPVEPAEPVEAVEVKADDEGVAADSSGDTDADGAQSREDEA